MENPLAALRAVLPQSPLANVGRDECAVYPDLHRGQAEPIAAAVLIPTLTVFEKSGTMVNQQFRLQRFAKAVATFPEGMDCYRMSGEIDYLIRLALPDIEAYDAFYKRLIAKVELSDVTSMFAMEEIKSTTRLPLNYLP